MTELDKLKSAVKLIHDFCSTQIRCSECPLQIEKNWRDECLWKSIHMIGMPKGFHQTDRIESDSKMKFLRISTKSGRVSRGIPQNMSELYG